MSKELPYFRFTAFEWLNDDISLESYEIKGLFSDICAYYWMQDCEVTLERLKKRFSNATILLDQLLKSDIIKHESKHDKIKIDFLLTQYDLLSEKRKVRQSAGSKGGNAKAMLKQKGSYKDKDNNKDNNKDNKDEAKPLLDYQLMIDFWLKEFHPDFNFNAIHGKAIKSIIKKIEKLRKNPNDSVVDTFKVICQRLPDWYKTKDLQIIDSKFNEIIEEIKQQNNGKSAKNSTKSNDTIIGINRILIEKGLFPSPNND